MSGRQPIGVTRPCSSHAHLKRYLPRFLALPFRAEPGGADRHQRKLEAGELTSCPTDAPIQFVPSSWRVALLDGPDRPDRQLWELAFAFASSLCMTAANSSSRWAVGGEFTVEGSRRAAERTETIAGVSKDKQRHVVVDCAPDEPREATKLYAFVQRAST